MILGITTLSTSSLSSMLINVVSPALSLSETYTLVRFGLVSFSPIVGLVEWGVNCVSHTVSTLKSVEWQEYCAVAFIP